MQTVIQSRISGIACLAAIIGGGLATNCDACPDPKPNAPPEIKNPAPGVSDPVAGCEDVLRFRAYSGLRESQCDGSDTNANPALPPGGELEATPGILRKCPDPGPFSVVTPFQVYWTICNHADRTPATLVDYELRVFTRSGGTETQSQVIPFTQPSLAPCDCVDVAVTFNKDDEEPKLSPGSYVFRLSGIYTSVTYDQADVIP